MSVCEMSKRLTLMVLVVSKMWNANHYSVETYLLCAVVFDQLRSVTVSSSWRPLAGQTCRSTRLCQGTSPCPGGVRPCRAQWRYDMYCWLPAHCFTTCSRKKEMPAQSILSMWVTYLSGKKETVEISVMTCSVIEVFLEKIFKKLAYCGIHT